MQLQTTWFDPPSRDVVVPLGQHHRLPPVGWSLVENVEQLQIELQRDVLSKIELLSKTEIPVVLEAVSHVASRGLHDGKRCRLLRAGATWVGSGYRGAGQGQSDLHAALRCDAAAMASPCLTVLGGIPQASD